MATAIYTIQPEDMAGGLMGIAQKLYGRADCWVRLFEANYATIGENPSVIAPGQSLVVPNLETGEANVAPAVVYVVQPADLEDGLLGIARRLLKSPDHWSGLYAANRATIGDDPARLQVGQHLIIPR